MNRRFAYAVDGTGRVLLSEGDVDEVIRTASVGKLLLLGRLAEELDAGRIDPAEQLRKDAVPLVADSGLWYLLDQPTLSVVDVARLVGAVSDNLATNVLLDRIGLDAVRDFAERHDLAPMELLDAVRDERDLSRPGVAETLSRASVRALVGFVQQLADGRIPARVREWMLLNTDQSMAAGAFGVDPLAHRESVDGGPLVLDKTGSDDGLRVDVGTATLGDRTVHFAVAALWDDGSEPVEHLAWMRSVGDRLRAHLGS